MSTLTMLTSASAVFGTTTSTLNDEGKIDSEKSKSLLGATALTAGTLAAASLQEKNTMDEIYEKYATAYIDSMSDKELADALEQLDLLEATMPENTTKSI